MTVNNVKLWTINYLSLSLSSLQSYPAVQSVFMRYNTSLMSSAPVESPFNCAGLIVTFRSNRLIEIMFQKLLLLKSNSESAWHWWCRQTLFKEWFVTYDFENKNNFKWFWFEIIWWTVIMILNHYSLQDFDFKHTHTHTTILRPSGFCPGLPRWAGTRKHGGRCSVGRVGHGPSKILVGWATMHLAPPIIGLYVR